MTADGESGEPAYVISDRAVESMFMALLSSQFLNLFFLACVQYHSFKSESINN